MKVRFIRHLLGGGDPDSARIYRWHILQRSGARMAAGLRTDGWKTCVEDYVLSAASLASSMALHGFVEQHAVPVDPDGELLGGAHRVACALALGIGDVPVIRHAQRAWAPSWGLDWFKDNGMAADDLTRLRADWLFLQRMEASQQ